MEQGLLIAYLALGLMAVIPIYVGSFKSLKRLPRTKPRLPESHPDYSSDEEEDTSETLSQEDAYWFPVIGSVVLFSLYLVFKLFDKEHVNMLLTAYFALIGVVALGNSMEAFVRWISGRKEHGYHFRLTKRGKELFHLRFTQLHIVCFIASGLGTVYYVVTKNWIMSNFLGLAFAASAVQLIALDTFSTGMILLMALFFYDIFWVFGTEVMVSVAKNFDAPIKVTFPKDLTAEKLQFTMLGLGDIVIPGVFVALCLRFDQWRRMKDDVQNMKTARDFSRPYFMACFAAYCLGLVTTVVVMHTFQAAQPALLYLSPACVGSVLLTGIVRGELGLVFSYKEEESGDKKKKDDDDDDDDDDDKKNEDASKDVAEGSGGDADEGETKKRRKGKKKKSE